jgi:3' terminal RNA ribose 2'-O-methyltransferase Hen1
MLLTITTTHSPATDLGYLLHKNPAPAQRYSLSFGAAYVVNPEASSDRCTAALVLDVDPVGLVRGRRGPEGGLLMEYVNDRPYVASSFLSVAMADVFGTATSGWSKERPELAETPIPLEPRLTSAPYRGGEAFLRRLFEPLGYVVHAEAEPLDSAITERPRLRHARSLRRAGDRRRLLAPQRPLSGAASSRSTSPARAASWSAWKPVEFFASMKSARNCALG